MTQIIGVTTFEGIFSGGKWEDVVHLLLKWVSSMFMGEYQHSVDTKGRLIIPAKFRERLTNSFVITRGLDSCLFDYPLDE